jgi:hypothetical protein
MLDPFVVSNRFYFLHFKNSRINLVVFEYALHMSLSKSHCFFIFVSSILIVVKVFFSFFAIFVLF